VRPISIVAAIATCALLGAPIHAAPAKHLGEPVVLLHGLTLNAMSMKKLANGLQDSGFRTCRVNYPSRDYPIDTLALRFVLPKVKRCFPKDTVPLNFVTHSLGGILLRRIETLPGAPRIGRVVMIAPPNKGSEVVDSLKDWKLFALWNGPAGRELGTDSASLPNRLPPPRFEFGVIAATRSVEPWFSSLIPGDDDGKVAVEHTKLEGMRDFVTIPAPHTFVLWTDAAVKQSVSFLRTGKFEKPKP
jgi:triacylglycerol lipase